MSKVNNTRGAPPQAAPECPMITALYTVEGYGTRIGLHSRGKDIETPPGVEQPGIEFRCESSLSSKPGEDHLFTNYLQWINKGLTIIDENNEVWRKRRNISRRLKPQGDLDHELK